MSIIFSDPSCERATLSGIINHGSDCYYDVIDMLDENTFTVESNQLLWRCIHYAMKKDDTSKLDIAMIHSVSHELGISYILTRKEEIAHLQAVINYPASKENTRKFAAKIRKLQIGKMLHEQLETIQQDLLKLKGDETVLQILGMVEDPIFNFTKLLNDNSDVPTLIGEGTENRLKALAEKPISMMGISTGFPIYDQAIGGGLRDGTINVIGARPKTGKTVLSDNMGYYIANTFKIPVLNLDTEMLRVDHENRLLAMLNKVPINDIETGQFAKHASIKNKVFASAKQLDSIPLYHKSIAGLPLEEQLAILRRWIVKTVGLNLDGTAKRCVIIYDYLKLMDSAGIEKNLAEHQVLGFMMTTLHNFAVRYKVPILAFMQLNRDGITKETTDVASGSDRIIWLCSNFTIFKMKSDEEMAEDSVKNGNRKLVPVVARHGAGMDSKDYINCKMEGQFALVKEGRTKFEIGNINQHKDEGFVNENDEQEIPFNHN